MTSEPIRDPLHELFFPATNDQPCQEMPLRDQAVKIDRNESKPLDASAVPRPTVRLFVLTRHAESLANIKGVVSSHPERPVGLTPSGRAQARQLGAQLATLGIDLAVCSRLLRTQQTVELALQGRPIPVLIDEDFDEVRAGDFDEQPIEAYWSWELQHTKSAQLPHGESLDDALLRYAEGLRRLLSRTEAVTLLVIHELALHHIVVGATTSQVPISPSSFANALPYLFDERAIQRAVTHIEKSTQSLRSETR